MGPFGQIGGIIVWIARRFLLIVASFWVTEFLLYKNMSILFPHYITRLRDDFWAIFCCGWNILFGILLTNIEWILNKETHHPPIYLFMSGEGEIIQSPQQILSFLIVWVVITILALSLIIIQPTKNKPSPEQQFGFNNMKHNPAIVNSLQMLFVIVILLLVIYPSIFVNDVGPNAFVLKTIPMSIQAYLIAPICFYAFNNKLRKYVWREMKQFLGLDLQTIEPC